MPSKNIPDLKIGSTHARIPIIQGGMGVGISLSGLAAAVAREGGIGVIATAGIGMLEPDFNTNFKEANRRALKKEIRKARQMTDGIIGVNIMVALSDFDELCKVAGRSGSGFSGGGSPFEKSCEFTFEQIGKSHYKSRAHRFFGEGGKNYFSILGKKL